VNSDSGGLVGDEFALAGVNAHSGVELEMVQRGANRVRAANRARRAVEGCEEAVARSVYFTPAEVCDLSADDAVVSRQQLATGGVAEFGRACGGADEIREQAGQQDAIGLRARAGLAQEALDLNRNLRRKKDASRVVAGNPNEPRVRDPPLHVACGLLPVAAIEEERGYADCRQNLAQIRLGVDAIQRIGCGRARADT
jgi:hypothetical protein